jgi:hypothetical protein
VGFGALAPDGKTLVFTAGRGLLAYDVAARKVRALGAVREVAGVGFEPSGRSVLVVGAGGSTVRLDAKTGAEVPA